MLNLLPVVKSETIQTIFAESIKGSIDLVKLVKIVSEENPEIVKIIWSATQLSKDHESAAVLAGLLTYYSLRCQLETDSLEKLL